MVTRSPTRGLLILLTICSALSPLLAESREKKGRGLEVESTPAGAMVFLDDAFAGVTPLAVPALKEGLHLLRVTRDGYETHVKAIEFRAGMPPIEVALRPVAIGTLVVDSAPVSGEVILNGRARGETPLKLELPVGTYAAKITASGYHLARRQLQVRAGQQTEWKADLVSRTESFLLGRIEEEPWRVAYYYELAHHYLLHDEGIDRAVELIGRGLRATVDIRTPTSEASRLSYELWNFYRSQFKFGTPETRQALQVKVRELVEETVREQPRNVYAHIQLALLRPKPDETLEIYRNALKAMKSDRAKRYYAYMCISIVRKKTSQLLAQAAGLQKAAAALSAKARAAGAKADAKLKKSVEDKQAEVRAKYLEAIKLLESTADEMPKTENTMSCLSQMATIYQSYLKDTGKYIETLHRAIRDFPGYELSATYSKTLGDHFYLNKEYGKAIEEYRRYVQSYPGPSSRIEVWNRIAKCYITLNNRASAAKEYEALIAAHPDRDTNAETLVHLIALYKDLGKPAKSAECQKRLLTGYLFTTAAERHDTDPKRVEARKEAALKLAEAAKAAAKLLQLKQERLKLEALAKTHAQKQETAEAEAKKKEAAAVQAQLNEAAEQVIASYRPIARGFAQFPAGRTAQARIIQAAASYLDKPERAQEERRTFARLFPEDDRSEAYLYEVGTEYQKAEEVEKAAQAYQTVIEEYPGSEQALTAHTAIIGLYTRKRSEEHRIKYVEAIQSFAKRYPKDARTASYLSQLGTMYRYLAYPGDMERGQKVFALLEKLFPFSTTTIASERTRTLIDDGMQKVESAIE